MREKSIQPEKDMALPKLYTHTHRNIPKMYENVISYLHKDWRGLLEGVEISFHLACRIQGWPSPVGPSPAGMFSSPDPIHVSPVRVIHRSRSEFFVAVFVVVIHGGPDRCVFETVSGAKAESGLWSAKSTSPCRERFQEYGVWNALHCGDHEADQEI